MVEARDLRVRYPRGPLALDGVTVMVHPGEVVAIVGPNGAGKSTLLRAMAGLVAPEAGTIHVDGESLIGQAPHRLAARGICYAPERARVLRTLSVRENLLIGAWLRRDRGAVARDLDRTFESFPPLAERRRRAAWSLSGGERQMLAIGRTLMAAPRVLLLDEPLVGLDPEARARVASIIRRLREEQLAVLLSEHDRAGAQEIADRAYGLRSGRVVFSGSAASLGHAAAFGEIYD